MQKSPQPLATVLKHFALLNHNAAQSNSNNVTRNQRLAV
jgi:hypothetical protein